MRILVLVIILQISGVTLYGCNVKMSNRGDHVVQANRE